MKRFKENFKLLIVLFVFWILLTLEFTIINIAIGIAISIFITIASYGVLYDKRGYRYRFPKFTVMTRYIIKLLIEIYKSSFSYIIMIIKKDCHPVIVEVPIDIVDPLIITIISNSITLTPGTLTVDSGKNRLLVLSIKDDGENGDKIRRDIKEKFEKFFL